MDEFTIATNLIREAQIGKLPQDKYKSFRKAIADALKAAFEHGREIGELQTDTQYALQMLRSSTGE